MAGANEGAVIDPEIEDVDQVPGDEVGAGGAEAGAEAEEVEGDKWYRRSGRLFINAAGNWERKGRLFSQEK